MARRLIQAAVLLVLAACGACALGKRGPIGAANRPFTVSEVATLRRAVGDGLPSGLRRSA